MSNFVNYLDQIKKQKEFTHSHATDFFFNTNYYYGTYYTNIPSFTNNEKASQVFQENQYTSFGDVREVDETHGVTPVKPCDYDLFIQYSQYSQYPSPTNLLQKPNDLWNVTDNNVVVKPKQLVNIEDNINNINDILFIVDKYKFDPSIEYNIDLLSINMIQAELRELNKMIGMKSLKESIMNQLLYFMQDLHLGKEGDYKHTVISGPPGTGKTEIAKIMGKMYSKLGILKKNVFKKVTRNDLVAGYLGQTAMKTKGVINDCLGGVLFIDEAYSLGTKENGDSYASECIDIICESLSDHKDDLMVIIAGYKDELNNNFFSMNKGLNSRFVWRFHIDNYTATELKEIFLQKISDSGWNLDENVKLTVQWFEKNYKNFKNYGRDMELLFFYVKISHGKRIFGKEKDIRKKITIDDIENGYKLFLENNHSKETQEIFGLYV